MAIESLLRCVEAEEVVKAHGGNRWDMLSLRGRHR